MRWQSKAYLHALLSVLPGGYHLNYAVQNWVVHSWPLPDHEIGIRVAQAREYIAIVESQGAVPVADGSFYEFGAGAELSHQLALYCLGVERQRLVDVRRLVRSSLVQSTVTSLRRLGPDLGLSRVPAKADGQPLADQLASYGITYDAPQDARATGLPAGSFDCITSTTTLEHIAPGDILQILRESRRLAAPGGLIACRIDYQDHYSYFDSSISVFNFLQFSAAKWRRYSPGLHFQNRLRHSDYVGLFTKAGWDIIETRTDPVSGSDLELLRALQVHREFADYDPHDLAIRGAVIIAKPLAG